MGVHHCVSPRRAQEAAEGASAAVVRTQSPPQVMPTERARLLKATSPGTHGRALGRDMELPESV